MKKLLIILCAGILVCNTTHSQGCIMVRNISGFGQYNLNDHSFSSSTWQLNIVSRYFKSFREFKDDEDQKNPEAGINHVFSTDFSVSRFFNKGYSINFSLPLNVKQSINNNRTWRKRYTQVYDTFLWCWRHPIDCL